MYGEENHECLKKPERIALAYWYPPTEELINMGLEKIWKCQNLSLVICFLTDAL